MDHFAWKDEYSVGVKLIDKQHQEFLGVMSEFYDAVNKNEKELILNDIFVKFIAYVNYHFATEEEYFDLYDYTGAKDHMAKHREFQNKINFYKIQFEKNENFQFPELFKYLEFWLLDHLMYFDKRYTTCFNEHGLI